MSKQNPEGEIMNQKFNRENIEAIPQIKLVDSDHENGLDLFSYIQCDESSDEIVKNCRGVVFNGEDIVFKGFSYTYEFTEHDNVDEIQKVVDFETCSFYESHEGAIIRIFYFKNKWYLSTNRKLDAFRSKWASKESFGNYFKQALTYQFKNNERIKEKLDCLSFTEDQNIIEFFCNNFLDIGKQYMFLILNSNENRIVCDPPNVPTMFHVGTFVDNELSMEEDVLIPYPVKHDFRTFDELFNYINEQNYKTSQGIVVFAPNNIQYKIFNRDYMYLYKIRGNEPSIKFRYLQIRQSSDAKEGLKFLYPEFTEQFDNYEKYLKRIATDINNAYIERYIKRNYVTVPSEEFKVMSLCHSWHSENRKENKININKVYEILVSEQPTSLNRMIKRRIQEEKDGFKNESNPSVVNNDYKPRKKYVSILTNQTIETK
jgi:hypothetical protein